MPTDPPDQAFPDDCPLWWLSGVSATPSAGSGDPGLGKPPVPTLKGVPPPSEIGEGDPAPSTLSKVYHQHTKDDWGTPQALFDRCRQECAFDLDAAASLENAKCDLFLGGAIDALKVEWWGKVWLNPPFSRVGAFMTKLIAELTAQRIGAAWVLVAARTDTAWWFRAVQFAAEIRFLKGRLTFEGAAHPAPFPSAILIFNPKIPIQRVRFWDWKSTPPIATTYAYGSVYGGKPKTLTLPILPSLNSLNLKGFLDDGTDI